MDNFLGKRLKYGSRANYQGLGGGLFCPFLEIERSDPVSLEKCPHYRDL